MLSNESIKAKAPAMALDRLAEEFVCQLAADNHVNPPTGWYLELEEMVREQVEDVILNLDLPDPHEWDRESEDDAADRERDRMAL